MSEGMTPDGLEEGAGVGPEYAGSADRGVVSSVGEHDRAAGDVVDAISHEHTKLQRLLDEMQALSERGEVEALRLRWGGVVRELLEHEVAEARVALPAAERVDGVGAAAELRRRSDEVVALLRQHDAFTPDDVAISYVQQTTDAVREHLRTVDDVLLPVLSRLPADERARLGEDLRQVMG
jgi:hemerythrin superfamily protein